MSTKRIQCRDHGGYFTVESRRGRPPVRCTEDNQCDAQRIPPTPARTAKSSLGKRQVDHASTTRTSVATDASSNVSATSDRDANWVTNRSDTTKKINELFRQLAVLGWVAKRGWIDNHHAEITATRGDEMLYIVVKAGMVIEQQYSLWHFDKPSLNGKPHGNLPFDPDEIGDRELAQFLVGTKVTWYNKLSGKEETAYCGKDNIRIEHGYNALGDEVPGERVVKFVNADPDHPRFSAFRLDSLLKVGK